MITRISLIPSVSVGSVTLKVECSRQLPAVVRVLDPSGAIMEALFWHLIGGSNITTLEGWPMAESTQYIVDILDEEVKLIGSKAFSIDKTIS